MLTHGNLLHQTGHRLAPTRPYDDSEPLPGELMVSTMTYQFDIYFCIRDQLKFVCTAVTTSRLAHH